MNSTHAYHALIAAALLSLSAAPAASAIEYDLQITPTVAIPTLDGTMWISTDFAKTTGTGVLDPFLSIQANTTESGYNIDSGVLDTKRNGQYTRTQLVSDLQKITVDGVEYYSFLLDINEPNNADSLISIDTIRLYTSNQLLPTYGDLLSSGNLQFNMDSITDNTLLYDDLNTGSGQGDVGFFIPVSAFAGVAPSDYFYFYQEFGYANAGFNSQSGFEETRHAGDITFVPIPETNAVLPILAVLGIVVAGPFVRRCFNP